ncbi:PepSY domain-containing protein [Piscibacillus sp. B03]|uniref:PepSY domain-containing protein n=1 Tax=Piscibacillus sp. B03 TaxID=3457430 RepID=UPI003FCCC7BE
MRRKVIAGALASTIAVGGTVGAVTYSDSLSKSSDQELDVNGEMESQATLNANKLIGVEELEDIVLNKVNGTIEEVELESKGKDQAYFEVEVKDGEKEYELIIDAYTGKILKLEEDADRKSDKTVSNEKQVKVDVNKEENQKQSDAKEPIGKEKAIILALEAVSGKVSEIELEEDDGYYVYEVEVKGQQEAGVTIDAYTGAILEVDYED